MDADALVKLVTGGSAVTVLGGICAWLLIRTIPAMQQTFTTAMQSMADRFAAEAKAQREAWDAWHDRLMNWLASQAGLSPTPAKLADKPKE
jgi:hypothetical protein